MGRFCRLSRELVARSGGLTRHRSDAWALSALGCDCVPVDTECNALAPAILYGVDARSKPQIDELLSNMGQTAHASFSGTILFVDIAPKILWFKENMPEVHERAAKFLTGVVVSMRKVDGAFYGGPLFGGGFSSPYDRYTWKVDARGMCSFLPA